MSDFERIWCLDHASHSTLYGSDRGRSAAVAGESLHSYGGEYQVDFERRRGDRSGAVAAEHNGNFSFPLANPRWVTCSRSDPVRDESEQPEAEQ